MEESFDMFETRIRTTSIGDKQIKQLQDTNWKLECQLYDTKGEIQDLKKKLEDVKKKLEPDHFMSEEITHLIKFVKHVIPDDRKKTDRQVLQLVLLDWLDKFDDEIDIPEKYYNVREL